MGRSVILQAESYTVIDRYGLPVAVLISLGMAVKFLLWPLILKLIENNQKQLDESNKRMEKMSSDFLGSLKYRDDMLASEFAKFYNRIDERLKGKL